MDTININILSLVIYCYFTQFYNYVKYFYKMKCMLLIPRNSLSREVNKKTLS